MIFTLIAAFWIICGVVHYGAALAFLQREFPSVARETIIADKRFAFVYAFMGPIALLADLFSGTFKHGLMYRSGNDKK